MGCPVRIRTRLCDERQSFGGSSGLANPFEVRLPLQQQAEPFSKDEMVVNQDDSDTHERDTAVSRRRDSRGP